MAMVIFRVEELEKKELTLYVDFSLLKRLS